MKTKCDDKKRCHKITFQTIDLDSPDDLAFDLESWLADLLIGHWLSDKGEDHTKGEPQNVTR